MWKPLRKHYDAIVVGSGPTGGWAAKTLTEAGMDVLVLEAGHRRLWGEAWLAVESARRRAGYRVENDPRALARQPMQAQCYAWKTHPHAFVDDVDNPYTTPKDKPFAWIRARQVGGRVVVRSHGLQFYRLGDFDFKAASRDGFGVDWPFSYAELAPYYDKVERFIRLVGNADDIPHLPNPIPAKQHLRVTNAEEHLQSAIARRWPDRKLIKRRTSAPPRPILAAAATGRLTLRSSAVVREVLVDHATGRARGVAWLEGGVERTATARVVVLGASTIESTRLLMNSRSTRYPDGLANSSDALGRYLMDHTHISGFESAMHLPRWRLHELVSWAYIAQFRNVTTKEPDFLRGYGISVFTYGRYCDFTAFGEMLPRATNRVTLDPIRKDKWGIPVARIDCEHSDNERLQAKDAMNQCREMLAAAGFEQKPLEPKLGPPGLAIHEVGTARMGSDPKTSVLNPFNECWDVKNLYVVDGACFVTQGVQNPTLTMMAISLRASENIVQRSRRMEL
jgi:choline dehydrogenase-like flavoprotein